MLGPAAPFRVVLRERNIRLLLAGLAVSQAGDWLYNLALLAFVYDRAAPRRTFRRSRPCCRSWPAPISCRRPTPRGSA